MIEFNFTLNSIDPREFFGINNNKLHIFKRAFPDLKITARGTEVKTVGPQELITLFEEKLNLIFEHYKKEKTLSEDELTSFLVNQAGVLVSSLKGDEPLVFGPNGLVVRAKTPNQRKMVEYSFSNDIVFALGPAGSGKTYTAVALAVRALKNKEVKKIILTRPAVEAGENLGFLPGNLKEKIDPYLRPLYDALEDMFPASKLETYIETGIIEIAPLAFMRGRTLDKAFVILDEAQNTTEMQLRMFLTRMGPTAKFVITGDLSQIDLPRNQKSGLLQVEKLMSHIEGIGFVYLTEDDVVRHRLVKQIIKAYQKYDESRNS